MKSNRFGWIVILIGILLLGGILFKSLPYIVGFVSSIFGLIVSVAIIAAFVFLVLIVFKRVTGKE